MCGKPLRPATWRRPSSVRWMVTHPVWLPPFEVIARISESRSSPLSFSFLTRDSIARLANDSLSPPYNPGCAFDISAFNSFTNHTCRWHINLWIIELISFSEAEFWEWEGTIPPMPDMEDIPWLIPVTSSVLLSHFSRLTVAARPVFPFQFLTNAHKINLQIWKIQIGFGDAMERQSQKWICQWAFELEIGIMLINLYI